MLNTTSTSRASRGRDGTFSPSFGYSLYSKSRTIGTFQTVSQKLSGKSSADVTLTYAPHHGEQEIRPGPVRQRMGLHQALSSCAHRARTPQDTRFTGDPRRRLLRTQDRLPMEATAERLPALEKRLRLVQEVAHRWYLRAAQRC